MKKGDLQGKPYSFGFLKRSLENFPNQSGIFVIPGLLRRKRLTMTTRNLQIRVETQCIASLRPERPYFHNRGSMTCGFLPTTLKIFTHLVKNH
jgi:hypothetical protein